MSESSNQVGMPTVTAARINALADDTTSSIDLDIDENISNNNEQSSYWAEQEQSLLVTKDLEKVSRDNQHQRDESWKNDFELVFRLLFWLLAFLFACMTVALISHWIFPKSWHWLSDSQIGQLETIVLAVLVSKAVSARQNKIE